MADFLIVEDFANQTQAHAAGDVLGDETHNIPLLRSQGAALIDFRPDLHAALVTQFRLQRRRRPDLQLLPILTAAGVTTETLTSVVIEAGATRTLTAADASRMILCTNAGGCTVTVPDTLPQGFSATFVQDAAGVVALSAGGSLTFLVTATALSPPRSLEPGAVIAITFIDETAGAERAVVYGRLG